MRVKSRPLLTAGARIKSVPRGQQSGWDQGKATLPVSVPSDFGAPPVRFESSEPDPYRRYWLERFTSDEIHEMARWLPSLGES